MFISKSKNNYINKNYFESIKKVQQNPEYQKNEYQIQTITNLLINHADIPRDIIELLIESVQENVAMEYESTKYYKFNKKVN